MSHSGTVLLLTAKKEAARRRKDVQTSEKFASAKQEKFAALQKAFERARQGEGLFGLKDAEQRRRGL